MQTTKRPSILTGAVVGALLTAPLTAIFFLGDTVASLALVPLDIFDWLARTLPGGLVTFGIDRMIDVITGLNLGRLDTAAKTSEQLMGIGFFIVLGAAIGALFFAFMRRTPLIDGLPGLIVGLAFGIPSLLISFSVNVTSAASPVVNVIWIMVLFVGWGLALQWVYRDLSDLPEEKPASPAPVETDAAVPAAEMKRLSRRQFLLRVGGATASITVVGAGLSAMLNSESSPSPASTGSSPTPSGANNQTAAASPITSDDFDPAPGTRPEYTPLDEHYRIDISTRPPEINASTWQLAFGGLVANEMSFSLSDLRENYEPVDQFITLSCISNSVGGSLISTTRWTGVPLQTILDEVQPSPDAGYLRIESADNFFEFLSLELVREDPRIMLCYAWDGQPLRQKHGFPLRVYIPNLYGMKQPKWITRITAVEDWEPGYWVVRGWSATAEVRTTSVIDTIAIDSVYEADGQQYVPMGGIAYSGARGISKVEVRVDDGEWQEARLRTPLSETTWVIWRYDWPFEEGRHTFTVRTFEADGTPQIADINPRRPDGATGLHSVETRV